MLTKALRLWTIPLLTMVFAMAAFAQTTASIKGTVTDPSGAAVSGAKVTVKNTARGIERTTQSNSTGYYEVPALPPGIYTVEVSGQGFQTQQATNVTLQVAQNSVQNFALKVASATEVVTVEATAPVIESTTMTVGQTINQNTVQNIPLNGRHFVDLALLIPGTVTPPQNGFLTAPLRGQGSFAFNTAGSREDAVNFMINGINLNDMVQNQVTFQPTINTVSEFKVDNSTYSAEYGRNSGAIVNIATRSGTNQFHGEVYDYLRNDWFDARNAFTRKGVSPIDPFKRNQFGGDFGGPIYRDRTFFFLSYEGLRQRQGLQVGSGVWSDAQRADIQAGGNPISIALMNLVPHANGVTSSGKPAFFGSATAPVDIDQGTADINHKISDNDNLHGYYVYQRDLREEPGATGGTNLPNFGDTRQGHRQVATLQETHTFTSMLVNEARIGANRILITFTPNNTLDPNSLGLGTLLGPNLTFMPAITVSDEGLQFGSERNFPQGRGDTTFVLADTVSYIHGRHSLKFGTEWRDFRNNNFNFDPGALVFNCSLNLSTPTTACPIVSGTTTTNAFALGRVSTASRTIGTVANRINQAALDFFAMDSFKVNSYLTLELGLRYAWNMTPSEALDRFTTLIPAVDPIGGAGSILVPVSQPYAQNNKNFQPRVGFAWDLFHDGNTVLRGGYAFQVDQPITGFVTGLNANPPFALPIAVAAATNATPIAITSLGTSFNGTPSSVSPVLINPDFKNADVQSWNLNIQQQVTRSTGFMIGYFGTKGTHLEIDRDVNQFTVLGTAASRPFRRLSVSSPILPGVGLGNVLTERDSSSNSNYHALWVTANKRMTQGLQFNASYTWSHSIDEASRNNNGIVVQDSNNIFNSRGSSDFDARHRFVVNAIYDLPFKGNRLVSGWEVAPIVSLQSGNPFTPVIASAAVTGVGNTVRPNVTATPIVTGDPLAPNWFANPTVFVAPPAGQLGVVGRNSFLGPDFKNLDLSIIKNTKLTERFNTQFRVDSFDLFNHPNFGQPGRVVGSSTFGQITSTRFPTGDSGSSRQLQFALKLMF
jgi:carboxypeptidase family protein